MSWRLVLVMLALLAAAILAAGQAITIAWLSSFPERASQVSSLEKQFWMYAILSAVLFIIDLALLVLRMHKRGKAEK